MTNHILNIEDIEYQDWQHGDRFEAKLGTISTRIGAQKLGYNLTVLAEFPDDDGGKPTVMRYIIRDQAGMAEYWEGE